ncbi:hypothetical protein ACFXTO_035181 [Malus domestica]
MEEQCDQFKGKNKDDLSKPYGRWFQSDVLDPSYRRPQGTCFGLGPLPGWSMKVPVDVEDEDEESRLVGRILGMVVDGEVVTRLGELVGNFQGQERELRDLNDEVTIPDLNAVLSFDLEPDEMVIDSLAIVLYQEIPMIAAVLRDITRDTSISFGGLRLFGIGLNVVPSGEDGSSNQTPQLRCGPLGDVVDSGLELGGPCIFSKSSPS